MVFRKRGNIKDDEKWVYGGFKFRNSIYLYWFYLCYTPKRYTRQRIERNQRYCTLSNSQDSKDEFRFVIKCPIFEHKRTNCIKSYYINRISIQKCVELMTSCNRTVIKNLKTDICQAFDKND